MLRQTLITIPNDNQPTIQPFAFYLILPTICFIVLTSVMSLRIYQASMLPFGTTGIRAVEIDGTPYVIHGNSMTCSTQSISNNSYDTLETCEIDLNGELLILNMKAKAKPFDPYSNQTLFGKCTASYAEEEIACYRTPPPANPFEAETAIKGSIKIVDTKVTAAAWLDFNSFTSFDGLLVSLSSSQLLSFLFLVGALISGISVYFIPSLISRYLLTSRGIHPENNVDSNRNLSRMKFSLSLLLGILFFALQVGVLFLTAF